MSLAVYVNAPVGDKEPVTWVATGQQALANTFVWDASNMQTLAVLQTGQKSINMYVHFVRYLIRRALCDLIPALSMLTFN